MVVAYPIKIKFVKYFPIIRNMTQNRAKRFKYSYGLKYIYMDYGASKLIHRMSSGSIKRGAKNMVQPTPTIIYVKYAN